jgi:transposase
LTHHNTASLLGKTVAPEAVQDDTVGRVLDRFYDPGTMKVFTAWAVWADRAFGFNKRDVHFDTTAITVPGDDLPPQEAGEAEVPVRITSGYNKDKRPDLKPFVFSTRCVDRAVPVWGQPKDGNASAKTVQHTLLSAIATFLATHGVAAEAYSDVAEAALVTEDNLAALGDTRVITRVHATSNECGRPMAKAVAYNAWEEVGVLAPPKPTKHRPVTSGKASAGEDTLDGTPYRAVVVHSSAQDHRQQQPLERDLQASQSTLPTAARTAEQQE